MQRQILTPLSADRCVYPLEPYDQENIIGVIGAGLDDQPACRCNTDCSGFIPEGLQYTLDVARNELHLEGCREVCNRGCRVLRLLVWAAPKEDACEHDKFLYEMFRSDIAAGARMRYASQVHLRDPQLIRSLGALPDFELAGARAKGKAMSVPSVSQTTGSGMWGNNIPCRSAF